MEQSDKSKDFDILFKKIVEFVKKHNVKKISLTIDKNSNTQLDVSYEIEGILKKEVID